MCEGLIFSKFPSNNDPFIVAEKPKFHSLYLLRVLAEYRKQLEYLATVFKVPKINQFGSVLLYFAQKSIFLF